MFCVSFYGILYHQHEVSYKRNNNRRSTRLAAYKECFKRHYESDTVSEEAVSLFVFGKELFMNNKNNLLKMILAGLFWRWRMSCRS